MHLYSSDDELAIEGTVAELNQLAETIIKLNNGDTHCLTASLDTMAEPYNELLEKIVLSCNSSKIKCSVSGKVLNLEFPENSREIVASYFSYFTSESVDGDHCHFDKIGNEELFDNESIEMVIQYGH